MVFGRHELRVFLASGGMWGTVIGVPAPAPAAYIAEQLSEAYNEAFSRFKRKIPDIRS